MHSRMRKNAVIVQLSATESAAFSVDGRKNLIKKLSVPAAIKGVDVCGDWLLIWTATDAHAFELETGTSVVFQVPDTASLAINKCFLFQIDGSTLKVISREGVMKKSLLLDDQQGYGACLDCSDDFLALITSTGHIRIWKLEGAELAPCGPCKVIPFSSYVSLRCNCDGTKLSFLLKDSTLGNHARIFVYDVVLDKVFDYDFRPSQRIPVEHCWDEREPKLLGCATALLVEGNEVPSGKCTLQVETFFATSEHGILKHSKLECDPKSELLGVSIPFMHFSKRSGFEASEPTLHDIYERKTLQSFENLEELDGKMQSAVLKFHANIAAGNINEAYRSIESIQDRVIWENLARFCVKSRLLEPARFCLAKMRSEIDMQNNTLISDCVTPETSLAAIAVQLGLLDDAENLYSQCKRYDLLNQFYQMCGNWDKAIQVASRHDFVHLKSTHHVYAKHLESMGNIKAATKHYELSDTHRYEVPRMLFSLQLLDELESYVKRSKDSALQQWWAHFCEANDNLRKAIEYYTAAGDIASVVRVYCYLNEFKAAAEVASHYSDGSATFQLALQHEKNGNVQEALHFFTGAGRSGYAAKLAMKHGIDSELLSLSLQSSKEVMNLSGKYFEKKGMHEEAVLLYQKGGNLERAVDLCIRSQLFDALKAIADDLDEGADPALLSRCGDFLMSHNQVEKAVVLYIAAKQHDRALDLCIKEEVTITDKLVDQFASTAAGNESEQFKQMIMTLAECCEAQGLFHLACKKYTQAGDRIKGMKALIKSRDTERIVLFANASRQKQLYLLSANYLQTLDWHEDPSLMRTIVQMYTKAGEVEAVAAFYESCAQIEIDEFRDYEKALGAMKEALKYEMKSTKSDNKERLGSLQKRSSEIERFVKARRMAKADATGMIRACSELIAQFGTQDANSETEAAAVRIGDVYALLVEYYFSQDNMEQAYHTLQKMKARKITMDSYIDQHIIDATYKSLGLGLNQAERLEQIEI